MATRKKHRSDIFVYDSRVKVDFTASEGEGVVTIKLMNEDPYYAKKEGRNAYAIAFERFTADEEGFMTPTNYNQAYAYALGLSQAREGIERMMKDKGIIID